MQKEYQKYLGLSNKFKQDIPEYPLGEYHGRGIVILAGGEKYFTCAWVTINMLRKWGCTLPIEIWHLGSQEMDDRMRELVKPFGVTTVDAHEVRKKHPARRLYGWELTPFALLYSRFEEIIFLDADNVPLVDPVFLFETKEYKEDGAIFWPDYGRLAKNRSIWQICDVPYRDEPEFESGQIVIDKHRCWAPLQMSMHINEHSDFYYTHIHGDKDTFHMAWHMMEQPYSMPSRGIDPLRATMCQHDFDGNRIFQHRNMDKWQLLGGNARIKGFKYEDECLAYVRELKLKWDGRVRPPEPSTPEGHRLKQLIVDTKVYTYKRGPTEARNIEFLPDGVIGKGAARCERNWHIQEDGEVPELYVSGDGTTFTAKLEDTVWKGKWVAHEQLPVELVPVQASAGAVASMPEDEAHEALVGRRFIYVRVGYDTRAISLGEGGLIVEGLGGLEKYWWTWQKNGQTVLGIGAEPQQPICELIRDAGSVWRGKWLDHEKMAIELVEIPA